MNIIDKINLYLNYTQVGKDRYGNTYYRSSKKGQDKRIVMYGGFDEPSKVPPEWHAWLHHLTSCESFCNDPHKYAWQKDHATNMTGTNRAIFPSGHNARRSRVSADYKPWDPNSLDMSS